MGFWLAFSPPGPSYVSSAPSEVNSTPPSVVLASRGYNLPLPLGFTKISAYLEILVLWVLARVLASRSQLPILRPIRDQPYASLTRARFKGM
jgi:hypothetical protein